MKVLKLLIISAIIIGLTFSPFSQTKAAAIIGDPSYWLKEFGLDLAARVISYRILKTVSNNVVRKVAVLGTGRIVGPGTDQGPVFVQNWRNFILESQHRGEDIWRGIMYIAANGDPGLEIPPLLCDHIRNSSVFKSLLPQSVPNLIQSGLNRRINSLQEYLVTAKCDSFVNENYETFLNDFNAGGGWNMFEKILQPQNNIYGAIELAMAELEKQRSLEEKVDISEVMSAKGFTGLRTGCVSVSPRSNRCTILGKVVTPGDILGESVVQTINQNLAFIANADEINETVVSLIGALIDRVFSGLDQSGDLEELTLPKQEIPPPPETPPPPRCRMEKIPGTDDFDIICDQ